MRTARRLALGAAAALALLLVLLVAVPFLFRDRIARGLQAEAAKRLDARVAWDGVSLSLLRDFPHATLTVDRISVANVAPFEGDTLAAMDRLRLGLDLSSVLGYVTHGARIVVREVRLERPRVRLRVLADGRNNWTIARPSADTASAEGGAVGVTLRSLRITDGLLSLDDAHAHQALSIVGLQEALEGDFGDARFTLRTRTRADSVSFRFAGVPYLSRATVELNADVDADTKAQRFAFRKDTLRVNALQLAFDGSVVTSHPAVALDLTFATPSTAFRDILSLVPAVYARDFAQLQASGAMAVSGRVNGRAGGGAFPALALRASVTNGSFRYPSLPLPARDIALDLAVDNPGGSSDATVVDLKRLHAAIGGRALDARLTMRTPVSDPDVDLRVAGSLDLADLARTVKLEGVNGLAGVVAADVATHARLSDVDAKRYEQVSAAGTLTVSRLAFAAKALPHPVRVDTVALRFTPSAAQLATLTARMGNSDVAASGALDNLLGFLLRGDDLRGTAALRSARFDLAELIPKETTEGIVPVPPHVDFTLRTAMRQVTYGKVVAEDVRGDVRVRDQRATLDSLRMNVLRGAVIASGFYETTVPARPTFDVSFSLASVDVPTAFATLNTVQKIAPVARWAQGSVSGALALRGAMDANMVPVFAGLTGQGEIGGDKLALQGVPALGKLADALSLEQVRNPTLGAMRAQFAIADGRVSVRPFPVHLGPTELTVGGSHGIDQTMAYDLTLAVPRALVAGAAGGAIAKLAARAGKPDALAAGGDAVTVSAKVTGTVTDPKVAVNFEGVAASARAAVEQAAQQQVAARVDAVKARADSAAEAARARARLEANRVVAEADSQAARIRADARVAAERAKAAAAARADSVVARASNPVAKIAAQKLAENIRKEADRAADKGVKEADAKAELLVRAARQRADSLAPPPAPPVSPKPAP